MLHINLVNSPDFAEVTITSIETANIREIAIEWLAKQALEKLRMPDFLKNTGANPTLLNNCLISIIA